MTTILGIAALAPMFVLALALLRARPGALAREVVVAATGPDSAIESVFAANIALAQIADRYAHDLAPELHERVLIRGFAALDAQARSARRQGALDGSPASDAGLLLRLLSPRAHARLARLLRRSPGGALPFDVIARRLARTIRPLPTGLEESVRARVDASRSRRIRSLR